MSYWRTRLLSAILLVGSLLASSPMLFANELSLADAVQRALEGNPELQLFVIKQSKLQGVKQTSALRPPLELSVEFENVAGSGGFKGFDSAETTVAISSIVELGDKQQRRLAAVNARERKLAIAKQLKSLQLIARVTRRYVNLLAAQEHAELSQNAASFAQQAQQSVQRRVEEGASPRSELLRANAAYRQSQLAIEESRSQQRIAQARLFELWGGEDWEGAQGIGDLFSLTPPMAETNFVESLNNNPNIDIFANEESVRQALLQLAISQGRGDIQWQVGARQYQESSDTALVLGINLPLFSGKRNNGEMIIARASVEEAKNDLDAATVRLRTQLTASVIEYRQLFDKVSVIQNDIIPLMEQALADAQSTYERGRYSYLDLVVVRQELLSTQQSLIDTAASALMIQADIEQITATPFTGSANQEANP